MSSKFNFCEHIKRIVAQCGQTMYALRLLVSRGLSGASLWDVTKATLISRLTYAMPFWWGFLDSADKRSLERIVAKAKRWRFLPESHPCVEELASKRDASLFREIIRNPNHTLAQLLPPVANSHHNLRRRVHNRQIPSVADSLMRKNFLFRLLFRDAY